MKRLFLTVVVCLAAFYCQAIGIEQCYQLARQNYPMAKQYGLTEQLGIYSFSNAARAYLPQVALMGQATYQSAVTEWPEQMSSLFQATGLEMQGLSRDQYKVMLQVCQPIWDGGASAAQKEQAQAQSAVDVLTIDQEIESLNAQINQVYFGILLMERNQETLRHADTLLRDNLKVVTSCRQNGAALQSDEDQLKVELLSLEQQQRQLSQSILAYRKVLGLLIGRPLGEDEVLELPAVPQYNIATSNRTELKLMDARISQIDASKKLLRSAVMPHVDVYAQGWYGRPGLNLFNDMMYNEFSWNYIAGLRLQWDISSWWTQRNRQSSLQVQQQSLQVKKETLLWNLNMQQEQLEGRIEKMRQTTELDEQIVALRRNILATSASKYRNGAITATDLLRDITNERDAKLTQSAHQIDLLLSLYDMKIHLNQ